MFQSALRAETRAEARRDCAKDAKVAKGSESQSALRPERGATKRRRFE